MSNQTFGAWLLGQRERQDTTGSMARAWVQLKEARGYTHSTLKSIRELLSSALGEDWGAMHGNETLAAAEAEWKGADAPTGEQQGVQAAHPGQQTAGFQGTNYMVQDRNAPPYDDGELAVTVGPPPMAVLVVDGHRYELTPGRQYVLTLGPVLREATDDESAQQDTAYGVTGQIILNGPVTETVLAREDGGFNWPALLAFAADVPDGVDLASLGLDEEQ